MATNCFKHGLRLLTIFVLLGFSSACKKSAIDQALDSDANGYLCRGCNAKFYTDRTVFANSCPNCKSMNVVQVIGFVCPADGHVTVAPRSVGSLACEKCGKTTSGLGIPREADFKAWGAAKKTRAEVGS